MSVIKGLGWKTFSSDIITGLSIAFPKLAAAIGTIPAAISAASSAFTAAGAGMSGLAAGATALFGTLSPLIPVIGGIIAAFAGFSVVSSVNKHMEELRAKAQESATSFDETRSSLKDYEDEVKDLRAIIADSTKSEGEHYSAKKRLVEIQDELTQSFGESAESLNLLNGEIETQIGLIDSLSLSKAKEFLTDSKNEIPKAKKMMEGIIGGEGGWGVSAGEYLATFYKDADTEESKAINDIIEKYKDYLQVDDNLDGTYNIRLVVNPEQAEEVIPQILNDIRLVEKEVGETDILESMFSNSKSVLSEADEISEKWKDIYDQAKQAKLVEESYGEDKVEYAYDGKNQSALEWINDYADAIERYNDALVNGDPSKVLEAKGNYDDMNTAIHSLLQQDGFSEFNDVVEQTEESLNKTGAAAAQLRAELTGKGLDDETKSLQKYADTLKGISDEDFDTIFLEKLSDDNVGVLSSDVEIAISHIVEEAKKLGTISTEPTQAEIEGLASSLVNAGILIHDTSLDTQNDMKEFTNEYDNLQEALNDTDEGGFGKSLDSYTDKLDTLKDAIEKFNEGDLTESDITELERQFPDLIGYADDLGAGLDELFAKDKSGLSGLFDDLIASFDGDKEAQKYLESLKNQYLELYDVMSKPLPLNINSETEKFSNMYGAVKNSRGATGLTDEDISNIRSMYSGLQSYDPSVLFERTENGIHLNTKALRELEVEYETLNKSKISSKLRELRTEMNNLSSADTTQKEKIQAQIDSLEILQAQYEGLTSTYNKWIQAQSSGNERDMYDAIGSGRDTVQDLINRGWVGSDEVRQYIDLISGKDLSTASIEELMTAWQEVNSTIEGTSFTAFDFFTKDSDGNSTADGVYNFFEAVNQKLGDGYAKIEKTVDENGNELETYAFDFSNGKGQKVAEALGLDAEYIQSILRAAIEAGFDVDLNSAWEQDLDSAVKTIEEKRDELEAAGTEPIEINFEVKAGANKDTTEIQNEIDKVKAEIDRINKTPVELRTDADTQNLEYYTEALDILIQKKIEAGQPEYMYIDVSSATASMADCLQRLQNFKQAENELNQLVLTPGVDDSQIEAAKQKVHDAAVEIQNLPDDVKTKIGITGEDSVDSITEKLKSLDPDQEIFLTVQDNDTIDTVDDLKETLEDIEDSSVTITIDIAGESLETVEKLRDTINELRDIEPIDISAKVEGTDDTTDLKTAIDSLYTKTVMAKANVYGTKETKSLKAAIDSLYTKVVMAKANVYGTKDVKDLKSAIDKLYDKTVTVNHVTNNTTNNITKNRVVKVDGSAYANGTAHKEGNWGLKDSGFALGGELGQELLVRDGRFYTIGDESAEFFKYKKGDIIFNADQTREIFEKGKILHGKKRGKAFATGSAFADASSGSGVRYVNRSNWTPSSSSNYKPSSTYVRTADTSGGVSNEQTAADAFKDWLEKLFDWIEIKLERQTRKIEKYTTRADAALEGRNYGSAASNYVNAISASSVQITNNENGAKRYKSVADQTLSNAVGKGIVTQDVANVIAQQVADGTIDVSEYSQEIQEVINSYKEWYDKSLDCADAVETLHQNIRKYVQSLKDVRDSQRDVAIDQAESLSSIGTSGYTSTSGKYYGLVNSQLDYSSYALRRQNDAYKEETNNVISDANSLGKSATASITSQSKKTNNAAYKKALKNAQSAIKAKKAVSASDLKVIKSHSTSTYEQLYAYNLQLENVETARMEQATAYAANSSEIFKNIAQKYENRDTATNNKLDLYKQKAQNAASAESANQNLANVASQYDELLTNDKAEVSNYSKRLNTTKATIKKSNATQRGSGYSNLSKASKKNVDKYIDEAQKAAKDGSAMSATLLTQLAKYYSKGYITLAFYQACIDYNNALESQRQAKAQYEIDKQTAKAEKASIGSQMVDNVVNEYSNKLNENSVKTTAIKTNQSMKTTRGLSLTKGDYTDLINQSKKNQQIYADEVAAINTQIQQNLTNGYWTTSSQEYKDAINTLEDYKDKAAQCAIEQESWNNSIAELPYKKLQDALDTLDTIYDNFKSLLSIDAAKGISETADQYRQEISNVNDQIAKYTDLRTQAWADYQKALSSSDRVYGGKTADELLNQYYKYDTTINNLTKDVVDLNNSIIGLPYDKLESAIELLENVKENYESLLSVNEAKGIMETEKQYRQEIVNTNNEILKYTDLRNQAWADYQKALSSSDGVYGGKTADEWLKSYYKYDTTINDLTKDVVDLNNAVAQLPYDRIEKSLDYLKSLDSYNKSVIDLKSAQGIDLSEEDYNSQITGNNKQISELESERAQAYKDYLKALADANGVYGGKTKEEWLKMYNDFGTEINNLKSDNEQLKDSLRDDVFWKSYERAHDACKRYADTLSGIKNLIDEDMYFDSDGKITDYGVSQLANLVGEYENARKEVQNYSDDITNLNDLYSKGYYTQDEYVKKLSELQNSLMDSASDMKSVMKEIMDMYKNMAQSELDSLFEIIDARNDALSAKKEYYDYDKTISSKTKDIQSLQAQIAALEGVETAEAKAKRATLEAQLSDAQDDLNDTINDHMFELSQNSLNDMKDVLQDAFDDKWDSVSGNLEEIADFMAAANTLTASSTATINDTLNELLRFYGVDPVSTGIKKAAGYASGTKRANKDETAWVNEYGTELMVSPTDNAILAGVKKDTGIIPAGLTDNLFDWGEIDPAHFISSMTRKLNDRSSTGQIGTSINQHYDSLLNVEGNVDSTVVSDMEKLTKSFYKGAYEYTVKEIVRDARACGVKV